MKRNSKWCTHIACVEVSLRFKMEGLHVFMHAVIRYTQTTEHGNKKSTELA